MSLKLQEGDYLPDGAGCFQSSNGKEALLQRILFQLSARRGSFPLLPAFGSKLYTLPREKPALRPALARKYVAEALSNETEVELIEVRWEETLGRLTVLLNWAGETLFVSLRPEEGASHENSQ